MSNYKGNGHCIKCGALTTTTSKYCYECRRVIRRIAKRQSLDERKAEQDAAEAAKPKKQIIPLAEVVHLADAAGMSYAKYCLKYGI